MTASDLVSRVVRDDVRAMHAYAVADATGLVKLDAMENPFALPDDAARPNSRRGSPTLALNRYPPPRADALRATIRSARWGCPTVATCCSATAPTS